MKFMTELLVSTDRERMKVHPSQQSPEREKNSLREQGSSKRRHSTLTFADLKTLNPEHAKLVDCSVIFPNRSSGRA